MNLLRRLRHRLAHRLHLHGVWPECRWNGDQLILGSICATCGLWEPVGPIRPSWTCVECLAEDKP